MDEPNPKVATNPVVFALNPGESFSIIPGRYLDFNNDDAAASNLIAADFELISGDVSRKVGDYIALNEFVALRNFLTRAHTAKIGETMRFNSEEKLRRSEHLSFAMASSKMKSYHFMESTSAGLPHNQIFDLSKCPPTKN